MKMNVYKVYLDDGRSDEVIKTFVPAKSKKEAIDYCAGNGYVDFIKDVGDDYNIDIEHLREVLQNNFYGKAETEIITRLIEITGLAR